MASSLTLDSVVRAVSEQESCDLGDGEVVILGLSEGAYYGLDAVGARVWQLIGEGRSVGDLCDQLVSEYDVERDRCERELLALLQALLEARLIHVE